MNKARTSLLLMVPYILFLLGLITLWTGVKTADEVHRLALASTAVIPLGWGYFSSPFLFQCLSGLFILGAYQIYLSYN